MNSSEQMTDADFNDDSDKSSSLGHDPPTVTSPAHPSSGLNDDSETKNSLHDITPDAPGVTSSSLPSDDTRSTSSLARTRPSDSASVGPAKQMKAASKSLQFYTTIVVKSCLYCKEWKGFCSSHKRSCVIFKKVECGLRDRQNYPLPPDVSLKDLMAFSFFQGGDAEERFAKYCVSDESPLEEAMSSKGDHLYANKFTDIKKLILNRVLPKFLDILKSVTGDEKRSG